MSFIADACALVAFHGFGGATMSPSGLTAMRTGEIMVSPITVWEITRKVALGKLPKPVLPGFKGSFSRYLRQNGYLLAPMGWDEGEHANTLPPIHQDPMDRILIATALLRDLTVITSDGNFPSYGVRTVW